MRFIRCASAPAFVGTPARDLTALNEDFKRRTREWMEERNVEARRKRAEEYVPTRSPGFFLLDMYPPSAADRLLQGLGALEQERDGVRRLRMEDFPRLQDQGYLRGAHHVELGTLLRKPPALPFQGVADGLPEPFHAVIVAVEQFPDLGFLVSFGFILEDDLGNHFREQYIQSGDYVAGIPRTGTGTSFGPRPFSRGRYGELQQTAKAWLATKVPGNWINQDRLDTESPTIDVFAFDDPEFVPKMEWTEKRRDALHVLGVARWESAAWDNSIVAPSAIQLRGQGTTHRGFCFIHGPPTEEERGSWAWTRMHKNNTKLRFAHLHLYAVYSAAYRLVFNVAPTEKALDGFEGRMKVLGEKIVAKRRLGLDTAKELQQLNDELATTRSAFEHERSEFNRTTRILDEWLRPNEWFGARLLYEKRYRKDEETFDWWLLEVAKHLREVLAGRWHDIDERYRRGSEYVATLFTSVNNISNLHIQRQIRILTAVAVALGIISVAVSLKPLIFGS